MNSVVSSGLCRMTVVAPVGSADIAVPVDLPLAHLLPILLSRGAGGTGQAGRWVLQRLGESPLDDESTPAQLGLRDGDVLYLRQAEAALPAIDFDDIVDGVNTAIQELPDRWQPAYSRRLLLAAGAVVVAAGLATAMISGPAGPRAVTCGVLAVLLVVGAAAFSRAFGDRAAATVLGTMAAGFAALGGSLLPALAGAGEPHGSNVLAGGALSCATAVLVSVAVGSATPFFAGLLGVALAGAFGGLLMVWPGVSAAGAVAAVLAVTYLASVLTPNLVARLVRLRVPALPSGRDDLAHDIEPHPETQVIARALAADRYLSAIGAAVALISATSFLLLAASGSVLARALVAMVAAGLLLRSRSLVATWQRLAAALPGTLGLAGLLVAVALHSSTVVRVVLAGTAVAVGIMLIAGSARPRGGRISPYWGRLADVAETITAIAVLPLAIGVMGGYALARGLAG